MRKSTLERRREAKNKKAKRFETDFDGLVRLLVDPEPDPAKREENPTQAVFIRSDAEVNAYVGAAGCAKTSTICAAMWVRALFQPGSKWFIARHDYNDLKRTTGERMEEMLNRLPVGTLIDRTKDAPERWIIQPIIRSINGVVRDEPCTFTFMGLKDQKGSYEFHGGIIDEADEVEEKAAKALAGRSRLKDYPFWMGLAMNPPVKEHWAYTGCTGLDALGRQVGGKWMVPYFPQSRENERNLRVGYYDSLRAIYPEDMIMRLVEGQWGAVYPGTPVYRQFKYKLHVTDLPHSEIGEVMFRFWDFGYRRPACIWAHVDLFGRVKCMLAELGQNEEMQPFASRIKKITATKFPSVSHWVDFGDPAVDQHKDTGKALYTLAKEGITMHFQHSFIDDGVALVRKELERLIDGEPALQFDRKGCVLLINALRGGYHMDDKGLKPVKDGTYEHLADAYRYGILNLRGGGISRSNTSNPRTPDYQPATVEYDPNQDSFSRYDEG